MSERRLANGRYLLFMDILGFSDLVQAKEADDIYAIVDDALRAFERWEELNKLFRTIYFSDTFIFYQEPKGYGKWAFLDVYAIGGMLFSALLSKGVPVRGAISFGEFEVRQNQSGRHAVYFGPALIEAYKAEQAESWLGISILKSAWEPFEAEDPGIVDTFTAERVWLRRDDDVLLLNPFIKLRRWHTYDLAGEIDKPYLEWDPPEFPNDVLAFKFLREQAAGYAARGDFTGRKAMKYHTTIAFLREVLGADLYDWGTRIANDERPTGKSA